MASKMLNKMMGFLGLEDDLEDEVEEFEETDNKKRCK